MVGVERVLRRNVMAILAFGLTFAFPNITRAQAPQTPATHKAWEKASFSTNAAVFDKDWARVLSDTQQMLRRFAATFQYADVMPVDPTTQAQSAAPLWIPNVLTYVPPAQKPLQFTVGAFRTTLTPVEFTSGVAAESRTLDGVLVGTQVDLGD